MKAVLFDLDGTLTDTFELWYRCVGGLVERHTEKLLKKKEYRSRYWGMDSRGKIRALITTEPEEVERLYGELQELLLSNIPLVTALPGVAETIRELAGTCKLGVISNSSMRFLEAQLSHVNLMRCFDARIADAKPKPDPDGLLRACRELKVKPVEAVFVGDSRFDEGAGKNAGIRTIIIGKDVKGIGEILREISGTGK